MKSPKTIETIPAETIPAGFLSTLQTEMINLAQQRAEITGRLSQISATLMMAKQYLPNIETIGFGEQAVGSNFAQQVASSTLAQPESSITPKTPRSRVGRPPANKNSDVKRIPPETVVLEALNAFGSQGGNLGDVKLWVQTNYPDTVYAPHIQRIALNRAWKSRKAAASEPVGKGIDPIYYSLNERPVTAVMAPVKRKNLDVAA